MSGLSLSEFAEQISEIMPVISREFYRQESNEFSKMKITMAQFIVLDALVRENELRMTDIARLMNVTTAAMTGIVERLVRDRYVIRMNDAEDRRIIKVKPTPRGNKIVKSMADQRKKMWGRVFGIISQPEREEYLRILTTVMTRLREQEKNS